MTAIETMMPQQRSSHTLRARQPTLRHAGSFSRCSGSNCFAWLLLAGCILVVSTGTSAMSAMAVEGHETTPVDLGALLDAGDSAVLTLVAGNTLLAVHRAVLAARSQVFAEMFAQNTLHASRQELVIPDVEGPDLRKLVAFMYSGTAPQHRGMTPQLLEAAKKYGVTGLRDAFEQQLARHLTVDNVAAKAVLAVTHNYPTLRQAAVDFIRDNAFQVMATQGWAEAVQNHPGAVVEFTRLLAEATTETSTPATADSEATTAIRPHSDDSRTSAAATPPSAHPHTPTPDDAALSSLSTPATEDSEATPTTRPHSGHGRSTAAAAPSWGCPNTPPLDEPNTPPLDEAAVSRLRSLSGEEKGERLIRAARQGAVGEVRALLAAGADVSARDERKWTALHQAAYYGHEAAVRCLLQAGAEVDARTNGEWTALHMSADINNAAVARLLLAASADPDARGWGGWTPLHLAALDGHAEVVTVLLEGGADRGARGVNGKTPLDAARDVYEKQVIQILETYHMSNKHLKKQ